MKWLQRLTLLFAVVMVQASHGQDSTSPDRAALPIDRPQTTVAAAADETPGRKHALIVCGHAGDDEHRQQFSETIESMHKGLTTIYGFRPEDVWIQFGGSIPVDDKSPLNQTRGECTSDALQKTATKLRSLLREQDTLWVVVMGHAHFDGEKSWLNLPGPDIEQGEFAKMFADVTCREQVFWITTPASGFYIQPLSRKGRVVISATDADREVNETIFPHILAELLKSPVEPDKFDADKDQTIALFDLYVNVTKQVAQQYQDENTLLTEHALLDDNGDGRGSGVHLDYLLPALGGRKTDSFTPKHLLNRDGTRAASISLGIEPK